MPINILVTGGAGFIGSHIVEFLTKQKDVKIIRIIDNLSTGKKLNIQDIIESCPRVEFILGDITDYSTCQLVVRDIDVICHQAAIASVPLSFDDPMLTHDNNINGTFNLLLAARKQGVNRFVYASSSSVYGDQQELPKQEDKIGKVLSPYALNKKITELYADVFHRCYGLECIGLRYFNVFGPRQDPNGAYAAVIPKFISLMKQGKSPTVNGDGSFSRDFVFVDNVVQANWAAITTKNKDCFGEVFNIGTGVRTTLFQLIQEINKNLKKQVDPKFNKIRHGDIPHSYADIDKAINLLNYQTRMSFTDGIKILVDKELS